MFLKSLQNCFHCNHLHIMMYFECYRRIREMGGRARRMSGQECFVQGKCSCHDFWPIRKNFRAHIFRPLSLCRVYFNGLNRFLVIAKANVEWLPYFKCSVTSSVNFRTCGGNRGRKDAFDWSHVIKGTVPKFIETC